MGAQQTLEWGIHYPEFMEGLLLIVACLAKRPARPGHLRCGRGGDQARPEVPGRQLYGPSRAMEIILGGMIYFPWLYSDEHLSTITDEAAWERKRHVRSGTALGRTRGTRTACCRDIMRQADSIPRSLSAGDLGKALAQGEGEKR